MIIIAAFVIGAFVGDWRARKASGNTRDRLHFAAVYALAFAAVGVLGTVALERIVQR